MRPFDSPFGEAHARMTRIINAGCAVVTTGSGGAMEIASAAELPLFPKDDSVALSRLLARLAMDRQEVLKIASRGQTVALRLFSFERMIGEWVRVFEALVGQGCQTDAHKELSVKKLANSQPARTPV